MNTWVRQKGMCCGVVMQKGGNVQWICRSQNVLSNSGLLEQSVSILYSVCFCWKLLQMPAGWRLWACWRNCWICSLYQHGINNSEVAGLFLCIMYKLIGVSWGCCSFSNRVHNSSDQWDHQEPAWSCSTGQVRHKSLYSYPRAHTVTVLFFWWCGVLNDPLKWLCNHTTLTWPVTSPRNDVSVKLRVQTEAASFCPDSKLCFLTSFLQPLPSLGAPTRPEWLALKRQWICNRQLTLYQAFPL